MAVIPSSKSLPFWAQDPGPQRRDTQLGLGHPQLGHVETSSGRDRSCLDDGFLGLDRIQILGRTSFIPLSTRIKWIQWTHLAVTMSP